MGAANFNTSLIPPARVQIARMIVNAFAEAGFGEPQQLAALANAMAESNLDPNARSVPPEQAVGLFQLNRAGGLGAGHTVAELEDPATNIGIVVSSAQRSDQFKKAASLDDAVSIFVHEIERPPNPASEAIRRLKIAEQLRAAS